MDPMGMSVSSSLDFDFAGLRFMEFLETFCCLCLSCCFIQNKSKFKHTAMLRERKINRCQLRHNLAFQPRHSITGSGSKTFAVLK